MRTFVILAAAAAMVATSASASHFRGATLIPEVDANGKLTVTAPNYWRKQSGGMIGSVRVSGPSGNVSASRTNIVADDAVSDSRRLFNLETFEAQLPSAGAYTISFGSCCWVGGVANNNNSSFGTESTIVWDGQTATKPINFALANIQQEVSRSSAYSDNLGVTGPGPFTYDDTFLALGVGSQPAGFDIDSNGTITMPLSTTSNIPDNTSNTGSGINVGADIAFSGQINSADGSSVQFVWVFDAVDQSAPNRAPDVGDVVINATVGDMINQLVTATDPDGDPVSLLLASFNGPGGAVGNAGFVDNGDDTGGFTWDSTGFAPGTYIAAIQGSDGSLTDNGQITINLTAGGTPPPPPPPGVIPVPAGALLGLTGLAALGGLGWRRRRG